MKIPTNGIIYHAEIHQNRDGLPWLCMIHGFMGSGKVFEPVLSNLKKFCNPVTIHLLGHGKTMGSLKPGRYRAEKQVDDICSILTRLKFKPLFLYGYSMGGRLALQFAVSHQELITGLILESTTCGISDDLKRKERQELDIERASHIEENFPDFLEKWQSMALFSGSNGNDNHKKLYKQVMASQKPEFIAASLRGFGTGFMPQVCDKLEELKKPALFIAGESDHKFVEIHKQMANKLIKGTAVEIPGAGHRVHADQPDEFLKQMKTFTDSHYYELENC